MSAPPSAVRRCARAMIVAVFAAASIAATTGGASAKVPTCPTNTSELTVITWGSPGPFGELADSDRGGTIALTGLARGARDVFPPPRIVTRRDRAGLGYPVLCAEGRVRARLPILRRGRTIQAASVNGTYLAWRETAPGAHGTIVRGDVRNARLRNVRRKTVPVRPGDEKNEHRIVVYANGMVGWALNSQSARSSSRAWAWPRTGPAKYAGTARNADDNSIRVVDSQNILLSRSTRLMRFAPATPGRCPTLNDGRPRPFGGWVQADIAGWGEYGEGGTTTGSWTTVCNPTTGKYIAVTLNSYSGYKSDSTASNVTHDVRIGATLLTISQETSGGSLGSTSASVLDTTTGRRYAIAGRSQGPGIIYREQPTGRPEEPVGAVVLPGVLAFVYTDAARAGATQTLRLIDANGARDIDRATPSLNAPASTSITNLSLAGGTLRWDHSGASRSVTVSPTPDSPFGVAEPGRP